MESINVIYANMPVGIRSYVVANADCSFTIVLNSRLTYERNLLSYVHEMNHIHNGDYEKKCDVDIIEFNTHHTLNFDTTEDYKNE